MTRSNNVERQLRAMQGLTCQVVKLILTGASKEVALPLLWTEPGDSKHVQRWAPEK